MTPASRRPEHEELRLLLGAHVLGGLDATDRAAVEEHLAECADCRQDIVPLAPLPGLLGRSPSAGKGPAPSDAGEVPLEPLLAAVRRDRARRRRRSRAGLTGIAATGVLAVAVSTTLPGDGGAPTDPPPAAISQLQPAAGTTTSGRAELVAKPWGTALTVSVTDLPAPGPYVLLATAPGEEPQQAAAWAATPTGAAIVTGATPLRPEQISAVQVLDVDGRVLATTTAG